jgi:hypothetical protein
MYAAIVVEDSLWGKLEAMLAALWRVVSVSGFKRRARALEEAVVAYVG